LKTVFKAFLIVYLITVAQLSYGQDLFWIRVEGDENFDDRNWKGFSDKSFGLMFRDSLKMALVGNG
jgi:hypothetical protein